MAKSVLPGEMKTRIIVKALVDGVDADGFPTEEWQSVFAEPRWCKWVNAHGSEALENARLNYGETATITMRYTPDINTRCRVWHAGGPEDDAHAWEVVGVNNVEDANRYLEISIRRTIKA